MKRLLLAAALAVFSPHAWSQDADAGREIFTRHCAVCHGIEATGQGPMQPVLLVAPADLTRLSAGNGGTFPLFRVVKRIDGRDPLVSHGSEMPVYGQFFDGEDVALKTDAGQPILTSQPVADLVAYLQTLQTGSD